MGEGRSVFSIDDNSTMAAANAAIRIGIAIAILRCPIPLGYDQNETEYSDG